MNFCKLYRNCSVICSFAALHTCSSNTCICNNNKVHVSTYRLLLLYDCTETTCIKILLSYALVTGYLSSYFFCSHSKTKRQKFLKLALQHYYFIPFQSIMKKKIIQGSRKSLFATTLKGGCKQGFLTFFLLFFIDSYRFFL